LDQYFRDRGVTLKQEGRVWKLVNDDEVGGVEGGTCARAPDKTMRGGNVAHWDSEVNTEICSSRVE
jgi:hypothetical protein